MTVIPEFDRARSEIDEAIDRLVASGDIRLGADEGLSRTLLDLFLDGMVHGLAAYAQIASGEIQPADVYRRLVPDLTTRLREAESHLARLTGDAVSAAGDVTGLIEEVADLVTAGYPGQAVGPAPILIEVPDAAQSEPTYGVTGYTGGAPIHRLWTYGPTLPEALVDLREKLKGEATDDEA